MRLRLDLLKHLTMEDIAEAAEANQHRHKPEPAFSKTGIGYLSPRSPEDSAREEAHSIELTQKLEARARRSLKVAEASRR